MDDWYDSFYDFSGGAAPSFDISDPSYYYPPGTFNFNTVGNPELDEVSNLTPDDIARMSDAGIFDSALPEGAADIANPAYFPQAPDNPMGYDPNASYNQPLPDFWGTLRKYGGDVVKFFQENPWAGKLLAGGAGALLGALDKRPPSGGGVARPYTSPKTQLTRTIDQGRYGPIARFAAQGGIMQAYRNGGQVRPFPMQDGGFVYTKRAVDGAGGPKGLASLVPSARMIRGPGHGTSDSIPAYIQGPNGRTPARVSNGEAYAPPDGQTQEHYALMKQLERKA